MEIIYITGTLASLILFMCALPSLLNLTENIALNEYDCTISNVTFPTNIPTVNNTNMDNFVTCDCGYRCTSDLGTCLNIYGSIDDITTVKHFKKNIVERTEQCTLTETMCRDGDSISNRINKINEITQIGNNYENLITNNDTIKCYYSSNNQYIYMEKNVDYTVVIVLFSLIFCIIIFMISYNHLNKKNKAKANIIA